MGCFNSKLRPYGHVDNPLRTQQEAKSSSRLTSVALQEAFPAEQCLHGIKLYGVATSGEAAFLCSRLVIARGHILAAVFEGHISPSAAEYCRSHCWEAFVQASASWQQAPAAAALRALDRGFLTSSKHSLEARFSSGCSATLLHVDLAARTVTVATVGAHGTVGLGSVSNSGSASGAGAAAAEAEAGRRAHTNGSGRHRRQQQQQYDPESGRGGRQDGAGGRDQRAAVGDPWASGRRPLSRFVTLEAPRPECRRGLSGLVDLVQSAMSPSSEHNAVAAAGTGTSTMPAMAPELFAAAVAPGGFGPGGAALARRTPSAASPQALGFGCAKDALLVSAFEGAAAAAAASAGTVVRAQATAVAMTPHAHGTQPPTGGRFAAINRIHCGCDVRVASRPLAPEDECLVLLAGCGGAGGRAGAARARPAPGSGGGNSSGGDSGNGSAAAARSVLGGGAAASNGPVGSSASTPGLFGPAGALSAADAVALAHELGAAAAVRGGGGAVLPMKTVGLTRENRFTVLYDSYDSEAAIATAMAGATPSPPLPPDAGQAPGAPAQVGDRSALGVASYAVAAALRNRGLEWPSRGAGAPLVAASDPSAACIAIWLDWGTEAERTSGSGVRIGEQGSAAQLSTPLPQAPSQPPPSQAAVRWELLRAYCRFLIARRRRITVAWHSLAAALTATPPLPLGGGAAAAGGSLWVPAQVVTLGGGGQGSYESVTGGGVSVNRTASFTSRAPVMMEFVEELPTPAPSVTVVTGRGSYARGAVSVTGDGSAAASTSAATGAAGGASASSTSVYAASAAAATLDESHTHSACAAAPYGISGLVVAPMGSTEDVGDPTSGDGDDGGAATVSPAAAAGGGGARAPWAAPQAAKRSFVMPVGSVLGARARGVLGLRPSRSTPDLQNMGSAPQAPADSPRCPRVDSSGNNGDSAAGRTADAAATGTAAQAVEAVAFARGSACHSGQPSSASVSAASAAVTTGSGAGGAGAHFDWSLVMATVNQNSGPTRPNNSAGHTPIPSTAVNRLSPLGCTPATGGAAGSDPQAAVSGGYLAIPGGGSFRQRQTAPAAPLAQSPLSSGLGLMYFPRGSSGAAAGAGTSRNDGGGGSSRGAPGFSSDMQPPPGVLVGRRSASDSTDGDGDAGDTEVETELISEDLPQLRIESTAELAALMAEIIITDDGEVVRTGSGLSAGGGGGGMPLPYSGGGRSYGLHHGMHHKGSRALSRQGSRGWQPRLAIVREDVREANTSTSCSQPLLGEGVHFTAISEERGSSQGSSGTGERVLQASDRGSSGNSQLSRLASNSNGSASNGGASSGSPNGSVEEQLAALGGSAAAAILAPPSVKRSPLHRGELPAGDTDASGGAPAAAPAAAAVADSHLPWSHSGANAARGIPVSVSGSPAWRGLTPFLAASQQYEQLAPTPPAPPLQSWHLTPAPTHFHAAVAQTASAAAAATATCTGADAALAGAVSLRDATSAGGSGSFTARRSAVAEAASSPAGADAALAAAITAAVGAPAQKMPLGAAPMQLWPRSDPYVAAAAPAGTGVPLPSPLRSPLPGDHTALEDVLDDLRPSQDRDHFAEGELAAGGAPAATLVISAAAAAAAAAAEGVGAGVGKSGDSVAEALRDWCQGGEDGHFRPTLAMVGRSRSASAARTPPLGHLRHHHHNRRSLRELHGVHQEPGVPQCAGGGTPGGGNECGKALHTHASPPQLGSGGRSQAHPHQASMPRTRHLYGFAEAPPAGATTAVARSYCAATTVTAAAPSPQMACDTVPGNTAMTIDRSWSMGSASGPLYSLLQSTLSKGSMTAATSTAVHTPGCNSAHGSGGRLPTLCTPPPPPQHGANVPPPLPLQASSPAAAPAAAALRVLTRPMSASREEANGLGSDSRRRGSTAADADAAADADVDTVDMGSAAAATQLPSLAVDCAAPAATATEDSASFSVTLRAPRFSDWEPHSGVGASAVLSSSAAASSGGIGGAAAADGVEEDGSYKPHEGSLMLAGRGDTTGGAHAHAFQLGSSLHQHPQQYHQHHFRGSALPPTRLSRSGFAGGESGFGSFAAVAPGSRVSTSAVPPHELLAGAGATAMAAAAASGTNAATMTSVRSPEVSSALALAPGASSSLLAPSAGLPRSLGGTPAGSSYGGMPYGAVAGGPVNTLAEPAGVYDDGATTNRSSNISRSDASVWNSTSAWTASTGRTTDMMLVGGSNRRVLMGTMGGGGGSSALMLQSGLALAGGLGGGGLGGDISGLLAYNAACSSASGLLMTADAGAPGSNTQLLMQMVPPPGAFGTGGAGGNGNGQHSSQLFCSPRQGAMFPFGGTMGAVGGGGGEGAVSHVPLTAALAAQVRACHSVYGAAPADSLLQQQHIQQQQLLLQQQQLQPVPACGDGRGGGPSTMEQQPTSHLAALPAPPRGAAAQAPPSFPPALQLAAASAVGAGAGQARHLQQPAAAASDRTKAARQQQPDMFQPSVGSMYDSNSQAPLFHEAVLDSASGCYLLAGGSTSNPQQ